MGAVFAAGAIPLIRRRFPPNSGYGFRTKKTLSDPKVWYDANEFSGRCLFKLGIAMSLSSLVLFFVPALGDILYAWTCHLIMLGGVAISVFLSHRYLNKITNM